ncbi:unnamed protein product [Vitrella brassicaformis CCMP3155]|uniref:Uncharacterized protein n=1 Tax=Vitrella brassicaformis (strain CCMP3155) TaxID=1169540 RepID=A0A0G4GZE9_VITBC|nr:unnamed protein product [Vitrella brassicaformis CCMP3155]|eukprot:CEM36620.1 unnamed protein product [Vitrella brassicaformis CCMP3155]
MAEYGSAVGGKLKLKGDVLKKSKKKRKREEQAAEQESSRAAAEDQDDDEDEEVPVEEGSGRLVTSGMTVNGFETKFKEEVELGDKILVHHPTSLEVEDRIVVGVLGQRSLTLHDKFSSDLLSTTAYHIKKDSIKIKRAAERSLAEREGEAAVADGEGLSDAMLKDEISKRLEKKLKKTKSILTYREKAGMGYKTIKEKMDRELTAEELLDKRVKKNRDKFCWF